MAYGRGGLYMDPSFQMGLALGNAYGNMWASNAKKRQGEHAKDILEEMRQQQQIEEIANMNKPQDAPKAPRKAVSVTGNIPGYDLRSSVGSDPTMGLSKATPDGRSVQENAVDEVLNLKRMGAYPITGMSGNIDLEKRPVVKNTDGTVSTVRSMSFNEDGKEILIPTITADGKPMTEQQAIDYYHTTGQNLGSFNTVDEANAAAERIHKSEERRVRALGQDGSANAPAAKLGFNPNFSVDEFKRRANELGLNKEVIDMYLPDVQKETAAQVRSNLLPEIMDGLYGYTNEKGEYVAPTPESYRNANEKLMLLKQYDPDTANPLLSGSITPRDIYTENRQNTVYDRTRQDLLNDRQDERVYKKQAAVDSFALKRAVSEQQFNDTVKRVMDAYGVSFKEAAQYVLGSGAVRSGRTNATNKSPLESAEYKEAKKIIEELNPEVLGRYLTADEVNLQHQANAIVQAAREKAFGVKNQNGNNSQAPDWNNYNQVIDFATKLFNNGATVEQVMSVLRDNMGDGPMYRDIISAWILDGSNKDQPVEKQESKLFENWGPADTRTGVAAGDFGSNGYTFWDLAGRAR